jgi:hypothetical protein
MAYTGELDLASLPHEQREFYFGTTLVTAENAQEWLDAQVLGTPEYDWTDPWSNVIGPIQYADAEAEATEEPSS